MSEVMDGCPSGQREQTVNLPVPAYGGSNPPPSTTICPPFVTSTGGGFIILRNTMKKPTIFITQTTVMLALLIAVQYATSFLGPLYGQFVTGSLVKVGALLIWASTTRS